MRELDWIISIICPSGIGSEVFGSTGAPVLALKVTNRSSLIIGSNGHSSLISFVVNGVSSKHPLSLFPEGLKNVVWAYFHDRYLLVHAGITGSSACLVLSDFPITSSWNFLWLEDHKFRVLEVRIGHRTVLVTKGFVLSIGKPIIVGLVMSVVLIEAVI